MKVVEENVNIMNFLFGWSSSTTSEPADASSTRWRKKSRLKSRQQRRQSLPTAEFEPARDNLPASSSTSTTWTHQPRGRHPSVLSTTSRTSSASLSSHSTIGDSYYGRRRDNIAYDELEELRDGTSSIFPLETPFIPPRTVSLADPITTEQDLRRVISFASNGDLEALRHLLKRTAAPVDASLPWSAVTGLDWLDILSTVHTHPVPMWVSDINASKPLPINKIAAAKEMSITEEMQLLRDEIGITPLAAACVAGRVDAVKVLMEEFRADPTACDNVALFVATVGGHIPVIELLLSFGASLEAAQPIPILSEPSVFSCTTSGLSLNPMVWAARVNNLQALNLFLNHKSSHHSCSIAAEPAVWVPALEAAAREGHSEACRSIILAVKQIGKEKEELDVLNGADGVGMRFFTSSSFDSAKSFPAKLGWSPASFAEKTLKRSSSLSVNSSPLVSSTWAEPEKPYLNSSGWSFLFDARVDVVGSQPFPVPIMVGSPFTAPSTLSSSSNSSSPFSTSLPRNFSCSTHQLSSSPTWTVALGPCSSPLGPHSIHAPDDISSCIQSASLSKRSIPPRQLSIHTALQAAVTRSRWEVVSYFVHDVYGPALDAGAAIDPYGFAAYEEARASLSTLLKRNLSTSSSSSSISQTTICDAPTHKLRPVSLAISSKQRTSASVFPTEMLSSPRNTAKLFQPLVVTSLSKRSSLLGSSLRTAKRGTSRADAAEAVKALNPVVAADPEDSTDEKGVRQTSLINAVD